MLGTTIEVLLVLVAFILGYYTKFFQQAYRTIRKSPSMREGVRAVLKALTSSRTYIPLLFMLILISAVIGLNIWQSHSDTITQDERDKALIQSVNNHTDDKIQQSNQKVQDLIDTINKLITTLEAQNVSGNTTSANTTK
jgi:hypothetical protein